MPFGDGTGPLGKGPRTGRGLGPCNGYSTAPAYQNRGFGRGAGRGRGFAWQYIEELEQKIKELEAKLKERI